MTCFGEVGFRQRLKLTVYLLLCMVVKRGIWIIMITTDWTLWGIIAFAEFLVVAGVKVCHVFCFTVKLCICHMVDQNALDIICDNNIIRTLAVINKWKPGLFLSKYLIPLTIIAFSDIKCRIWTWHTTVKKYSSARVRKCTFFSVFCFTFFIF